MPGQLEADHHLAAVVGFVGDQVAEEGGGVGLEAFDPPVTGEGPFRAGWRWPAPEAWSARISASLLRALSLLELFEPGEQVRRRRICSHISRTLCDVGQLLADAPAFTGGLVAEAGLGDLRQQVEVDAVVDRPGFDQLLVAAHAFLILSSVVPTEQGSGRCRVESTLLPLAAGRYSLFRRCRSRRRGTAKRAESAELQEFHQWTSRIIR